MTPPRASLGVGEQPHPGEFRQGWHDIRLGRAGRPGWWTRPGGMIPLGSEEPGRLCILVRTEKPGSLRPTDDMEKNQV